MPDHPSGPPGQPGPATEGSGPAQGFLERDMTAPQLRRDPEFVERRRPFLSARWSNVSLLTYRVPADLLEPYVHPDLVLDRWDGEALVSLVAFDFHDTRLRGRRIPGYVNFPEINLRTYVRHGDRRGVTFLREFVPSRVVAAVARWRYNEPYRALPMHSRTVGTATGLVVEHRWRWSGRSYHLRITASQTSSLPSEDSLAHFLKEHRWGFGRTRQGVLQHYRVEHPVWALRNIRAVDFEVDFGALYGADWGFLNDEAPISALLAVGSAVAVYPPGR